MSVLSEENQKKFEELLVSSKLLSATQINDIKKQATEKKAPFLSYLLQNQYITSEQFTKLTSQVLGIPYVNLIASKVNPSILNLLSREVAERFMAVPLGEMEHRLAVAMIDPNNVQAVDFLSNKISRPLKVYMASEEGIRHVLEQYNTDLQKGMSEAITSVDADLESDESLTGIIDTDNKPKKDDAKEITTIVQDSPISRALSTILEYAVMV